jgi:hypothetical protein
MIKLKKLLRASTGTLGYLFFYTFNSQILGDESIVNSLGSTVASAPKVIPIIKEFLGEAIPGEVVEKLKNLKDDLAYGRNDDLDEVIITALNHAIENTKSATIKSFNADDLNAREIKHFADYIKVSFDDFVVSEENLNQFLHNRGLFLASILDANNYTYPEITCASPDDFYAFFFETFISAFEKYFLEELKRDDKAKTAYFVFLLEISAQLGKENNELLLQLSATAKELEEKIGKSIDLLRSIARIQNQILTVLSKQGTDFKLFRDDFKDFEKLTAASQEPALTLFYSGGETKPAQRFNFKERFTNFVGREKEVELLWKFFTEEPENSFKWWMVTGSGGMGKSRLALEFCLEARHLNYHVGFLATSDITRLDWSRWQPEYPTLIVIDYAITQHDQLIDSLLSTLSNHESSLSKNVRILLLDRNLRSDWLNKIKALPTVEKTFYKDDISDVLTLTDLGDEFLWGIITQTFQESGKELNVNKLEILAELEKIDSQKRPLFAFFAGVALAEGESIRDWNVSELLSYHLNNASFGFNRLVINYLC